MADGTALIDGLLDKDGEELRIPVGASLGDGDGAGDSVGDVVGAAEGLEVVGASVGVVEGCSDNDGR